MREQMQVELIRLQRQVGITFILVTHDQHEAFAMFFTCVLNKFWHLFRIGHQRDKQLPQLAISDRAEELSPQAAR